MDTAEMPQVLVPRASAAPAPARRARPRHRPPPVLRIFAALVGLGVMLFNGALMMSDRAPGALRRLGGDFAVRLSERIDSDSAVGAAVAGRLPESDFLVHVGVWAVAVLFAGLAVWSWRWLLVAAVSVFSASVFVEAAQGIYTDTRAVEIDDVVANGFGVLTGVFAVAMLYALWGGLAMLVRSVRH